MRSFMDQAIKEQRDTNSKQRNSTKTKSRKMPGNTANEGTAKTKGPPTDTILSFRFTSRSLSGFSLVCI